MRLVWFFLSLSLTVTLVWFMNRPIPAGDNTLPPLGSFFSPQHGFWQNAESTHSGHISQIISLEGIQENIQVYFDQEMIPRIYVKNDLDAAFAQGYVAAYLRLFQMDISTRSPIGRLSEVFGDRTLKHDLGQRRKGLLEAAERLAASWDSHPESGPLLHAFIDGINARIAQLDPADLPLEYKLLDFEPEPWDLIRCAAFYLAMSETLAQTAHDIPLSNAHRIVGPVDFDLLYKDKNPYDIPVIPTLDTSLTLNTGTFSSQNSIDNKGRLWTYEDLVETSVPGVGSNNWAIAPERTINGFPILCNDPHLTLTLPSIWLEMQISTPDYQAYGVAFSCLPGIAIGFNNDIAWGFTNAGHDVQDWYAIRWANAAKTKYILDGNETDAILREEIIHVRGNKNPIRDTVRFTIWGPVPHLSAGPSETDLAMHWLPVQDLNPTMSMIFSRLNKVKNVEGWRNLLLPYDAPMQNALFASKSGDIALRVSGKMPLRKAGAGRLPMEGSTSDNAWPGFVPAEMNPYVKNPSQGYVASANQQSTNSDFPYPYTGIFEDWRGRYLNEQLQSPDTFSVDKMMALQNDNTSLLAKEALATFIPLLDSSGLNPKEKMALQALMNWDHKFDGMNNVPVLFELWFDQVEKMSWDELFAMADSIPIEIPEDWRMLDLLKTYPELTWWDIQATPDAENASQVISLAFKAAVSKWEEYNEKGEAYWSAFKGTTIRHIARIPSFSTHVLELGGHHSALNAITSTNGPSWRMVVELGPQMRAFGVYPGGQSGNPGSPFYRNFLDTWIKGEYRTLKVYGSAQEARDVASLSIEMNKQ